MILFSHTCGSNVKALPIMSGHSKPHLQVPSVCKYCRRWSKLHSLAPLGLKTKMKFNACRNQNKKIDTK